MALTQTQLVAQIAEETELSKADIKNVLASLEEIILSEINNAEKVKIGSLVQLNVKLKPATKARKGRNPATGEEITISAKPASVQLKARPLAKAKASLPTVAKAKKRLS
jgi:nucleoid DNA-binding protein